MILISNLKIHETGFVKIDMGKYNLIHDLKTPKSKQGPEKFYKFH